MKTEDPNYQPKEPLNPKKFKMYRNTAMHSNYYRSTQRCTTQCARTCTAGPPQTTRETRSDVNTPTPTPKNVPPLTSS